MTQELLPRTHTYLYRTIAVTPVQGSLILRPEGALEDAACGPFLQEGSGNFNYLSYFFSKVMTF